MSFRERMEDNDFAFAFTTEEGEPLFTAYGKDEGSYMISAPLYENEENLAVYYIKTMEDVLRFMQDVYGLSESDLDEVIAEAAMESTVEEEETVENEAPVFVPGELDEAAEFGGER